jgi:hypothetical protein
MRKPVFFILLATAAIPAMAAAPDPDSRSGGFRGARAERSEDGGLRSQRAARSEPADSGERAERPVERSERVRGPRTERTPHIVQSSDGPNHRSRSGDSVRRGRTGGRSGDGGQTAAVVSSDSTETVTNWRARERRAPPADGTTVTEPTTSRYRGSGDRSRTDWGDRTRNIQSGTAGARSTSWRNRDRDDHGRRWSSNWRNDHRYNWRSHRSRYSSIFRLGRYNDPFGYGYRRYSTGLTLGSGYYGNNYWLDDPWQYRLPAAYGQYRWIRYYNDALLVNVFSGEVIDVVHGFFW